MSLADRCVSSKWLRTSVAMAGSRGHDPLLAALAGEAHQRQAIEAKIRRAEIEDFLDEGHSRQKQQCADTAGVWHKVKD